jgi:hypothetical protein
MDQDRNLKQYAENRPLNCLNPMIALGQTRRSNPRQRSFGYEILPMDNHRRLGRHHRCLRSFLAANPFCVLTFFPPCGHVDQGRGARLRRTNSELGHC